MEQDKKSRKKLIYFSFVFIVLTLIFLYLFSVVFEQKINEDFWDTEFSESFDVDVKGYSYTNIDISEVSFPHTKKGDEVLIKKRLPLKLNAPSILVFRSRHSTVEVDVAGDKIYDYGSERYERHKMLGSGYHIIPLKSEHAGKTLTIRLRVGNDDAYRHITFLRLCKSYDPLYGIFQPLSVPLLLDIFLIFFGGLGIITCFIFMIFFRTVFRTYIHISVISICLGIWSSSNFGFFQVFSNSYELGTALEYISLYIALYSYISVVGELKKDKKYTLIIRIEKIVYLVFLFFVFLLNILSLSHLSSFLNVFKLLAGISVVIAVAVMGRDFEKQQFFERVLFFGNIVFFCSILIMFFFSFIGYDFGDVGKAYSGNSFVIISMLGMIMTFFISYALMWFNAKKYEQERVMLQKLAYNDALTGLGNRQKAMMVLYDCVRKKIPYSIALFDLNNLKTINDIFGHAEGDRLIIDFSECLKKAFPEDYLKVRVGGDEFMVIGINAPLVNMKEYSDELELLVEKLNREYGKGFILEAAYGVAGSVETTASNYEDVVQLADKRMYDNKRKMKSRDLSFYLNQ